MIVLGLFAFGMNPGACLLRDGRLVAFAEEERFARVKCAPEHFPGRAVRFCLAQAGLQLADVDRIAVAWDAHKYPYRMFASLAQQYLKYRGRALCTSPGKKSDSTLVTALVTLLKYGPARMREEIRLGLRAQGLSGDVPEIEFVPHHLCHAYSAYFCSPFEQAVVLTLDGSGEDTCTQVAVGRGERLHVSHSIGVPHSLGWYYAAFTAYLGFVPYMEEGKVMALAGWGAERERDNPWPERLDRVLRQHGSGYEVDPVFTRFGPHSYAERFTDALADWITGFDPRLAPIPSGGRGSANGVAGGARERCLEPAYVDLAFGVQKKLERTVLAMARHAAAEHQVRNVCIAGGVGLNCKLNGVLRQDPAIDGLFVQPASYDAGSSLGAAMVVSEAAGDPVRNVMTHAYWGPEWTNAQIRETLHHCKLDAQECPDIAARTADELAAGRLVGWFQGRMELGARALGARSILAGPHVPGVKDTLNREVKRREPWRPFGPSILAEAQHEWLSDGRSTEFMTVAVEVPESRRETLSGAVHVDGTCRPQSVKAEANPTYHRMLKEFRARTGLPCVINTSFNVQGEPILCTPLEAVRCFYSTGLDALAIGDFFLTKT
jgi:carbamoyltransferase